MKVHECNAPMEKKVAMLLLLLLLLLSLRFHVGPSLRRIPPKGCGCCKHVGGSHLNDDALLPSQEPRGVRRPFHPSSPS